MLSFPRFLVLLINIDQETILNWFGIETPKPSEYLINDSSGLSTIETNSNSAISVETFELIINSFWQRVQTGLTLTDIENILFFLVFLRFIILAVRYNLKTSFYITCIGLCAGYLWYRHLVDMILMYRQLLMKIPYLKKLSGSAFAIDYSSQALMKTDLKVAADVHWYTPGKLLYYAFTKGIVHTDPETNRPYYIDPISMVISNLDQATQLKILPRYYQIYNTIIPQFFQTVSEFWNQLSGIAAYAVITRIGKRYCPYLIRWHWTFLLIIGFAEQILIYFLYRLLYFQDVILLPQLLIRPALKSISNPIDPNLLVQANLVTSILTFFVIMHLGCLVLGLFHAICGQYFYVPFLVENTELHIGPRPKNSIYSGGQTSWQDEKEVNLQRQIPKLWYGWFGSGTNENWIFTPFKEFFVTNLKKLMRQFKK